MRVATSIRPALTQGRNPEHSQVEPEVDGWWPAGRPHPEWCARVGSHDDVDPTRYLCVSEPVTIDLSAVQHPEVQGDWLRVGVQQHVADGSPVIRVMAGELAAHARTLTLEEAERHALAVLGAVSEARAGGDGTAPGVTVWRREGVAVEWGVRLPHVDGEPDDVDVRPSFEEALGAFARYCRVLTGVALVWRASGTAGPWVVMCEEGEAPVLPVVGGNSTVTHSRSQSDDYRTHGETRVQDGAGRD